MNQNEMMTPAARLDKIRRELGLTQQGLADILCVSRVAVNYWVRGINRIPRWVWKMLELREALALAPDEKGGRVTK